jgi:hypothetical protein
MSIFSLISFKNESEAYEITSQSVRPCVPHQYFLNQSLHDHGIQHEDNVTEGGLEAIVLNLTASVILKWWRFRRPRWINTL